MGKSRGFLVRAAVLAGCAAALWAAGLVAAARAADLRDQARAAALRVKETAVPARRLAEARSSGGARVQRMARSEADSWAYWESVARQSGISTDSLSIDPSFTEPPEGAAGPTLLTTSVHLSGVTLRQLLAFLYHMTEERPYVGISSVDAANAKSGGWDATVASFVYFEAPAGGAGGPG